MTSPLALITGGSRGIGRATALALAADGVDIVITYRTGADSAAGVVSDIEALGQRAIALPLDVGEPESIASFVEALAVALRGHFDRDTVDYLVNNAGHAVPSPLSTTTADDIDSLYAVHFRGPFLLTQSLSPSLADGGAIVNISSGLARFAVPGNSVYGAMKAAIDHLTRYWAKELGDRHIRVNSVAPGPVATDFGGGRNRDNAQIREYLSTQTALGRVGEPAEIATVIAGVLSERMSWVTGQRIEASGGIFL